MEVQVLMHAMPGGIFSYQISFSVHLIPYAIDYSGVIFY